MTEKNATFNAPQRKVTRRRKSLPDGNGKPGETNSNKADLRFEQQKPEDPQRSEVIYRLIEVIKSL